MNDALRVSVIKRTGNPGKDTQGPFHWHRGFLGAKNVTEGLGRYELHHNVGGSLLLGKVEGGDDIGVSQPTRRLGLTQQSSPLFFKLLGRDVFPEVDDLDRDHAAQECIESAVYKTHAAAPDFFLEFVSSEATH